MFELLTQILLLVGLFFLIRFVLLQFIPRNVLTWIGGIVLILVLLLALLEPTNRTIGIAWSILSFPLRPLGLALVLLGSSLRLGVKKADGNQVLAALLVLLITSLPITAYLLTAQTEQRSVIEAIDRREDTTAEIGAVQAIVVTGDGTLPTDPSYRIRTQINNATQGFGTSLASRLAFTSELYQQQVARGNEPLVIVSGGPLPDDSQGGVSNVTESISSQLSDFGVPRDVVVVEPNAVGARESAIETQRIFAETGFQGPARIILVAPALSIRRATSAFQKLNFDVIPRPTDFYVFQLQGGLRLAAITDLIPSVEALVITTRVIEEYLATVYYFMRGWLVDPLGL